MGDDHYLEEYYRNLPKEPIENHHGEVASINLGLTCGYCNSMMDICYNPMHGMVQVSCPSCGFAGPCASQAMDALENFEMMIGESCERAKDNLRHHGL